MEATAPKIVKLHIWRYPEVPADEHPWIVTELLDNGQATEDPWEFRTFPEAVAHASALARELAAA